MRTYLSRHASFWARTLARGDVRCGDDASPCALPRSLALEDDLAGSLPRAATSKVLARSLQVGGKDATRELPISAGLPGVPNAIRSPGSRLRKNEESVRDGVGRAFG
jgi:hypothetical protein